MNPTGVRSSIWLFGIAVLLLSGLVVYQATRPTDRDAESDEALTLDHHGRRGHRAHDGAGRRDRHLARTHRDPGRGLQRGDGYRRHDWRSESDLQRAMALHLPTPGFWRDPDVIERSQDDPQMIAMWRSFHGRRDSATDDPALPFEPTAHRLTLVDAEGDVGASPSSCDVRVLPVAASEFNCVIRVMCDGRVLYPDDRQRAGYVRCEMNDDGRIVRAVDSGHTDGDGDPAVDYDLEGGTITVEDYSPEGERRYRATLRIQS